MIESDTMVWLHAFKKKNQKRPTIDLELAEKRMREVLGL
jgi:phage-related protein